MTESKATAPGEELRTPTDEEQRLLPAHAPADRVDPTRIDAQPRSRGTKDRRHAREIVDLPAPAPRVERQPSPHPPGQTTAKSPCPGRSRHRFAFVRARTPRPCGEITSGNGGDGLSGAVLRRRHDDGPAGHAVVGSVANPPVLDPVAHPECREPWRAHARTSTRPPLSRQPGPTSPPVTQNSVVGGGVAEARIDGVQPAAVLGDRRRHVEVRGRDAAEHSAARRFDENAIFAMTFRRFCTT